MNEGESMDIFIYQEISFIWGTFIKIKREYFSLINQPNMRMQNLQCFKLSEVRLFLTFGEFSKKTIHFCLLIILRLKMVAWLPLIKILKLPSITCLNLQISMVIFPKQNFPHLNSPISWPINSAKIKII